MDRVDLNGGLSGCARWNFCTAVSVQTCTQEPTSGNVHSICVVSSKCRGSSIETGGVVSLCLPAALCTASLQLQQHSTVCLCTVLLWSGWGCSGPAPCGPTCCTMFSCVTACGLTLHLSTSARKRSDVGRREIKPLVRVLPCSLSLCGCGHVQVRCARLPARVSCTLRSSAVHRVLSRLGSNFCAPAAEC